MVGNRVSVFQSRFLLAISSVIFTFSFQLNYAEGLHPEHKTFLRARVRLKAASVQSSALWASGETTVFVQHTGVILYRKLRKWSHKDKASL